MSRSQQLDSGLQDRRPLRISKITQNSDPHSHQIFPKRLWRAGENQAATRASRYLAAPSASDSGQGLWPISKCRKGSRPVNSHHGYTDKGIEPPVLSYILQRPIRSVQYCEYVLYRMYYRYHTEPSFPLGNGLWPRTLANIQMT